MKIILQRLKYRILAHTMTWLIASQLQREYWFAAVALQLCRFYSFRRLRRLCQLCRILFFSPIIDFFSFCKSFIVFLSHVQCFTRLSLSPNLLMFFYSVLFSPESQYLHQFLFFLISLLSFLFILHIRTYVHISYIHMFHQNSISSFD